MSASEDNVLPSAAPYHARAAERLAAQYAIVRVLAEASSLSAAAPKLLEAVCMSLNLTREGRRHIVFARR
jgi:hypothetical protein